MYYLLQIFPLVFIVSCALLSEAFWSWLGFLGKNDLAGVCYKSLAMVAGLAIYAGIDYFMLDYLMLFPGKIYMLS